MGIIIYKTLQLQNAMNLIHLKLRKKTEKKGIFLFSFLYNPQEMIPSQLSFKGIEDLFYEGKKNPNLMCTKLPGRM